MRKADFLNFTNGLEKNIIVALNSVRSSRADDFSRAISNVSLLSMAWIAIPVMVVFNNLQEGIFLGVGLATAFLLNFLISDCLIKFAGRLFSIVRIRPHIAYPKEIRTIGRSMLDSSFPSSHVAAMTGGFTVLLHFYVFIWPFAVIAVILTAWSRMRNGMHYPSDIVGGIALGTLYGYLSLFFLDCLIGNLI